jgi:hypothetical protein
MTKSARPSQRKMIPIHQHPKNLVCYMDPTAPIQLMTAKLCRNKLVESKKLGTMYLWQNALIRNANVNNKSKKNRMNFMR